MTAIAVRDQPSALAPAGGVVSIIQQTALDLDAAHRIATAICATALAPRDYRGKPDDGAAVILYGATLGLDPMTSLQNVFIVHGSPAMYARTMSAVVRAQGHEIWTEHEDETSVTVCGRRAGSDKVESATFTMRDAERAGYTKQNTKYGTDPKSMLYARALSIACRRTAPDALLGIPYTVEELQDITDTAETVSSRSSVSRLRSAVPPVEAPALEPAAPAPGVTAAQRKKLGNLFDKHNMGRDDALAYTASAIGRTVESSAELTRDEAVTVIKALEALDEAVVDAEVVEPTADDIAEMNREANEQAVVEEPPSGLFGAE